MTDIIRLIASETEGIKNVHSIYLSQLPEHMEKYIDKKPYENKLDKIESTLFNKEVDTKSKIQNKDSNKLLHLYLDVQVDSGLDLRTAHNIIEIFESKVKEEIPIIKNITTHIEFENEQGKIIGIEKEVNSFHIEKIRKSCFKIKGVVDCKDIGIVDMGGDQHVTLTIIIQSSNPQDLTVYNAHQIATDVQQMVMYDTGATRVVIHAEPL
jgi:divalent metal cation (Fe/Co/Zn/Cd) transporter